MTEELETTAALPGEGETPAETAPELTETVEETVAPPETEATEATAEKPKDHGGLQKRFDELTREKYDARREAEYWRSKALAGPVQPVEQPKPAAAPSDFAPPQEDDFENYEQYLVALGRYGAQVELQNIERQKHEEQQRQTVEQQVRENQAWLERGTVKYPNLVETVMRPGNRFNAVTRDFAMISPYGHDIVNKLAVDDALREKVFAMNPVQAVMELQKLEANFKAPQKATTSAPASTSPVTGSEVPVKSYEDMDYEEYKRERNRQLYGG